jgi:drug/metabolite transporter (DMT)-like permease
VPALVTIGSLPFGVKPSRLEVLGIVAGFVGVLMLVRGHGFAASPGGLIAMTIAALGWSIGSVLSQHMVPLARGSAGFASQLICGGVAMLAVSVLAGEALHWPPQPLAIAAWAYLVVFGSLIAFVAYMVLLSNTTPALATSYTFVNPVIALILGVSFGGEIVTRDEWIAVAIIIVGVTIVIVGRGVRPAVAATTAGTISGRDSAQTR